MPSRRRELLAARKISISIHPPSGSTEAPVEVDGAPGYPNYEIVIIVSEDMATKPDYLPAWHRLCASQRSNASRQKSINTEAPGFFMSGISRRSNQIG